MLCSYPGSLANDQKCARKFCCKTSKICINLDIIFTNEMGMKKLYVPLLIVVLAGIMLISGCSSPQAAPAAPSVPSQLTPVISDTIVTPVSTPFVPVKCNGWEYNRSTEDCVQDISTNIYRVVPLGHSMCQGKEFDTVTDQCVFDNGTKRYGIAPLGSGSCNGVYFNNSTSYCAKDEGSYDRNAPIEHWAPVKIGSKSCYLTSYDPLTQVCVTGAGVVDSHPCVGNDEVYDCCGGMAYEYRLFRCCQGKIFDVTTFRCSNASAKDFK